MFSIKNKKPLTENVALGDQAQQGVRNLAGGAGDDNFNWCFGHFFSSLKEVCFENFKYPVIVYKLYGLRKGVTIT